MLSIRPSLTEEELSISLDLVDRLYWYLRENKHKNTTLLQQLKRLRHKLLRQRINVIRAHNLSNGRPIDYLRLDNRVRIGNRFVVSLSKAVTTSLDHLY